MWTSRHPRFDELSDYLTHGSSRTRERIAVHLTGCQACRESVELVRNATRAAKAIETPGPSSALRARVLADLGSGTRPSLPLTDIVYPPQRRWILPAAAAVVLAVLGVALVARGPREIEAGTTSGTLTLIPAAPRAGQRVEARYQPSALLRGQPRLSLRARLRARSGPSYNAGLPTVSLAVLHPDGDARTGAYVGTFTLPDSIVYGVLAVEDSSTAVIDDNATRGWELLVSNAEGQPLLEALDQRAKDMMGRNWEEGFATARRMVALYPDDLRAWTWLRSFQGWAGHADDDSIRLLHRHRLAYFDSAFAHGRIASIDQVGRMDWYAFQVDSSTEVRWRTRLLHVAPANSFAVQWRLIDIMTALHHSLAAKDTVVTFRQLDELWDVAPQERREQVSNAGVGLAFQSGDPVLIERWTSRLREGAQDKPAARRWVATRFSELPALRREGIRRLRGELDSLMSLTPFDRALGETLAEQRKRHGSARRRLLSTLGEALVADGQLAEGRRTLSEAASTGWDLAVFRAVRTASLASGDTARALTMTAWLAIDPRTTREAADSLRSFAERRVGTDAWRAQLDSARTGYVRRMLADASVRSLPRSLRIRSLDGQSRQLRDLTNGVVTVIAFWSRSCAPAIDALPAMRTLADRLALDGVRFVSIMADESSPSPALKAFLARQAVTIPTYLDSWQEASRAFNQWGTPSYYVVDSDGRVRFSVTNDIEEALARAEALQMAGAATTTARAAR